MGGLLSTRVGSDPYYSSLESRFERLQADTQRINVRPSRCLLCFPGLHKSPALLEQHCQHV